MDTTQTIFFSGTQNDPQEPKSIRHPLYITFTRLHYARTIVHTQPSTLTNALHSYPKCTYITQIAYWTLECNYRILPKPNTLGTRDAIYITYYLATPSPAPYDTHRTQHRENRRPLLRNEGHELTWDLGTSEQHTQPRGHT